MNVERANQTLQDIVQEVLGELLVEEASAYVLGQQEADLQLNQVRTQPSTLPSRCQGATTSINAAVWLDIGLGLRLQQREPQHSTWRWTLL